ncbi:ATP-binding protein [Bacillus sp. FJAT-49736]|uniref:ATP-binding protein n=1 Tax=Bacillus sp. FJAT-49736 TaxID=2833582 RepID=UPI001BC965EB|nr:ATP-binding protein [Bacillus sp. FJAT-49736]MBS4174285.1 response regulator [Bacillus sp. FJAT-49736]
MLNTDNYKERSKIAEKEKIAQAINVDFNQAFFDARGYLAFGSASMKDSALAQEKKIKRSAKKFEKITTTDDDEKFLDNVNEFTSFYFEDTLPLVISNYKVGNRQEIAKMANEQVTSKVTTFQKQMQDYIQDLDHSLDSHFQKLITMQSYIQLIFLLFVLIVMVILLVIMMYMFRQLGQPLARLSIAANEMASGKEVSISLETKREDEIGLLSKSFQQMVEKVQEKEQDLLAHNEELIAQQDELQAQQAELQNAMQTLNENSEKLKNRNKLVNQLSGNIDLQYLLDSSVVNMCKIIQADKGIIALAEEPAYASFGISPSGANQFLQNMKDSLCEQLRITKRPYSFKRKLDVSEKGYHEGDFYGYDLYLPVLSSDEDLIAVMIFTRYGSPFEESQMEEFLALSNSVGVSLDKISLFQKSEKDRKQNQDILNTLQEGVQLIDKNGRTLQINDHLQELLECEDYVLLGMSWEEWIEFVKEKVKEKQIVLFLENALHSNSELDTFIYTLESSQKVIKVYSKKLYHDGVKIGTVLVHRDITKEYEVDQMKSEFVSTVSHELRTPLSSILGFTELMINRELKPERQKKYLTTIWNESKRLTALINDFLDVQRMEAGKQTYEKKYFNLLPMLSKVIEAQQVSTKLHQIILEPCSPPPFILGDREKMEQVFTNLINNAVKYSPDGGMIKVKLTYIDQQVKVEIIDHGLGIPEEAMNKLFTKFYRVDNSDRRKIGGTGLGLSIVQEIVKNHDGEISVQSTLGSGSTFTVLLPAALSKEMDMEQNDMRESTEGYHILLIEDDKSLAELIKHELVENGFQVIYHNNGADGLQSLHKTIPDAIVLDILLEDDEFDGWRIMQEIKQSSRLQHIPIIISTALDEKEKGISLGAMAYLVKPYQPSQLSKTIMQTLLKVGKEGQILVPQEEHAEG